MTDARIVDRGYRPYDGPRLGLGASMWSLTRHSAERVLGLRRPARSKVLPLLAAGIAYLPAIVFVGVAAFVNNAEFRRNLPTYGDYYGFVSAAIMVFVSFVAPEVLCPDRRTGMLGLYLASPLTRDSYLAAKAASVVSVLSLSTLGPPLLMLTAFTLQGLGPSGPGDVVVLLIRMVTAGVMLAVIYTAVSLALSSFTDRRTIASATVIMTLLVSDIVSEVIVDGLHGPAWVRCFDLLAAPFELVLRIYGQIGNQPDVATWALMVSNAAWAAVGFVVLRTRYQRLAVNR